MDESGFWGIFRDIVCIFIAASACFLFFMLGAIATIFLLLGDSILSMLNGMRMEEMNLWGWIAKTVFFVTFFWIFLILEDRYGEWKTILPLVIVFSFPMAYATNLAQRGNSSWEICFIMGNMPFLFLIMMNLISNFQNWMERR